MSTNAKAFCSQWIAARRQLSQALEAFDIACESLDTLGVHANVALKFAQPDFLISVDADFPVLLREADRMTRNLATMRKLRNRSTDLVAINRLPAELLASILSLAVHATRADLSLQVHQKKPLDFVNVVSSVSAYWRHVSLGTPTLWAEISFDRAGGADHAALWLERSRSCPLLLRSLLSEYDSHEQGLINLAGKHSSRFRSLVLGSDTTVGQEIFYNACEQYTEASVPLESLAVVGDLKSSRSNVQRDDLASKKQMNSFLTSVRTLHVKHRLFDGCTLQSFHDLTTLSLSFITSRVGPTCEDLLGVLIASPGLRCLELSYLDMNFMPQRDVTPINLPSLETVSLNFFVNSFARWFLESIIPHSEGIALTLAHFWEHWAIGFELPFLIPDRVKVLHVVARHSTTIGVDLSGLRRSLTRLQTLALRDARIVLVDSATHQSDTEITALGALDMVSCNIIDTDLFKSTIARHSIRQLRVFECEGCPTTDELLEILPALVISRKPGNFRTTFSPFD